jgi:hypothetical protein
MKLSKFITALLLGTVQGAPSLVKRDAGFAQGEPISADGKGGPILGIMRYHVDKTFIQWYDMTNVYRRHESPAGSPES